MAHLREVCLSVQSNNTWTDSFVGETIPIRLFLGGFDLTPTFREVNKKYSTRYYLSLVLIDEGMYQLRGSLHVLLHSDIWILLSSSCERLADCLRRCETVLQAV
jgi:hypothetical protein